MNKVPAPKRGEIVRAIDIGYGHVKYVLSSDPNTGQIECGRFPSRAPLSVGKDLSGSSIAKLDTWHVRVGEQTYEVGNDVINAAAANDSSEILSRDFALSDGYIARLYGALSYMLPKLPERHIDWLVLGLPNLTYDEMAQPLAKRVKGEHFLNARGDRVTIGNVLVYSQPMGVFFDYAFGQKKLSELKQMNTVIADPGYNTFDWLYMAGLAPSGARSDSVELGMNQVIRAMAQAILADPENKDKTKNVNLDRMINRIDHAIATNTEYRLKGKPIKLDKYYSAGTPIADQAISAMAKKIGEGGDDVDNIIIAGGGLPRYIDSLKRMFGDVNIVQIKNAQFSVLRGLQQGGENQARSANRAMAA